MEAAGLHICPPSYCYITNNPQSTYGGRRAAYMSSPLFANINNNLQSTYGARRATYVCSLLLARVGVHTCAIRY